MTFLTFLLLFLNFIGYAKSQLEYIVTYIHFNTKFVAALVLTTDYCAQ